MIADDIHRLDDILVLQCAPNAKLRGHLLLILPLGFALSLRPELLHRIRSSAVLARGLDETNRTASTRAQDAAPLAVLLRHLHMRRLR